VPSVGDWLDIFVSTTVSRLISTTNVSRLVAGTVSRLVSIINISRLVIDTIIRLVVTDNASRIVVNTASRLVTIDVGRLVGNTMSIYLSVTLISVALSL